MTERGFRSGPNEPEPLKQLKDNPGAVLHEFPQDYHPVRADRVLLLVVY
jgi:hypothetical protein